MIPEGNVAELQKAVDADVLAAYLNVRKKYDMLETSNPETVRVVKPHFSEEELQAGCAALLVEGDKGSMLDLLHATGIAPPFRESDVRDAYAALLKEGDIDDMEELKELTKVKPRFSYKDAQQGYMACFEAMRYFSLGGSAMKNARILKKMSGISPSNESVQKGYINILRGGIMDYFKDMRRLSGVKFTANDEQKKAVQEEYAKCFERNHIEYSKAIRMFTGVAPSEELLKKYPEFAEALK